MGAKKIFRPGGRGLYAGYTPDIVVFRLEPSDSTLCQVHVHDIIRHIRVLVVQWSGDEITARRRSCMRSCSHPYREYSTMVVKMRGKSSELSLREWKHFCGREAYAKWWRQRQGKRRTVRFMLESCGNEAGQTSRICWRGRNNKQVRANFHFLKFWTLGRTTFVTFQRPSLASLSSTS